jgi:hypothetical protein
LSNSTTGHFDGESLKTNGAASARNIRNNNMNLKSHFLHFCSAAACVAMAASASAATVSFAMNQPTPGPDDIANLQGAREEAKNVNEGDHDAIYIADDRLTQGQTFTTGTNAAGYVLRAITLREVAFDTYALVPDLTYTIRITQPEDGKLSVLSTETAKVAAETAGNFPITPTRHRSVLIIHHPNQRFWVIPPDKNLTKWPDVLASYSL